MDVYTGKTKRLRISMPPRHSKSESVSKYFASWLIMMKPEERVMLTSYESDFAASWGRKARDLVEESGHLFDVKINSKSSAANRWDLLDHAGGMVTAGVGGAITGKGANCLVADTQIITYNGYKYIQDINIGDLVATFNFNTNRPEWKTCQAIKDSTGSGIYRITTASGRVVESTGDHLFYTKERGWAKAHELTAGSTFMLLVPQDIYETGVRHEESYTEELHRSLLQPQLLSATSCNQKPSSLYNLSSSNRQENSQVLRYMLPHSSQNRAESQIPCEKNTMSDMRQAIYGHLARSSRWKISRVLRQVLCQRGTLTKNDRQGQPAIHTRRSSRSRDARMAKSMEAGSLSHANKRQLAVCGMQLYEETSGPSSRRRFLEQYQYEPDNSMRKMPHRRPSVPKENGEDKVVLVERVRENETVYDIQVAENHNFFANGILVHNCLIIDDPVRNAEDARSKTVQDKTWDWFTSTAYTRLEPGGAIIVIQTRWSDEDLSGRIMEQESSLDPDIRDPYPWVHLNLPAIAEYDEPPYRQRGEALWPERFDIDALQGIKNNISPYWWASLYQGSPTPDDGMIYRKAGERYWYQGENCYRLKQSDGTYREVSMDACFRFITVDLAVSEKQTSDYTVMSTWAGTPTKDLILLDCVRSHMTAPEKIPTMQRLKDRWQASYLAIEKFGYQLETVQNARFAGLPVHEIAPKGDKVAKSWEAAAKWESGQVYMPSNTAFVEELLMELYAFPNGKHDDFADTLSMAALEMSRAGDPMEAMGVVICHRCKHRFIRNAKIGMMRPCPKCGIGPEAPALTHVLEPQNEPNALS